MSLLLLLRPLVVRDTVHTTQVPDGSFNDGSAITLGTVFKSDVAGQVLGVRLYRAATAPSGPVVGGLFDITSETTGTELARATFGTLSTGWNTVLFAAPVSITANTLYVAAYNTPDHYVADWDLFAAPVVAGHLTGIQHGLPYANGRYNVGASLTFPGSNGNNASYFADPLFEASTSQTVTLGQAVETDTAGTVSRAKVVPLGRATETDTAGGLGRVKAAPLGRAVETDTAGVLTRSKTTGLGRATETDTAAALARLRLAPLGRAVEADTAAALTRRKLRLLGQTVEVDTATALSRSKRATFGQAAESDTAGHLSLGSPIVVTLGLAVELDTAGTLTRRKLRPVGQAVETCSAFGLARVKRRDLGRAVEVDVARSVSAPLALVTATALTATSSGGSTFTASTAGDRYSTTRTGPVYVATTRAP